MEILLNRMQRYNQSFVRAELESFDGCPPAEVRIEQALLKLEQTRRKADQPHKALSSWAQQQAFFTSCQCIRYESTMQALAGYDCLSIS